MVILNYLIVCFIFGTTFLVIKVGIDGGIAPLFSAGIRFSLAGLMVLCYFMFRRSPGLHLLLSRQVIVVGFCLTFMTFATLYWAEQYITSGLAAALSATGPMMVFFLQANKTKEQIKFVQYGGLLIGFVGVLLISSPGLLYDVTLYWFLGSIAVVIGDIFYSYGAVYSKDFLQSLDHISPFLVNGIQMLYGGVMLLIVSFIVEEPSIAMLQVTDVQLSLVYLIFIGSIGGHGLFYWLVNKTNPVFPSTWLYVSPVIALITGAIVLGEEIRPITVLGAILVLGGVLLVNGRLLRSHYKEGKLLKKAS